MMKQVFVCKDTVTGIFSAVYDAWKTGLSEDCVGITLRGMINMELFCEYTESEECEQKVIAVEKMIQEHLGGEVYRALSYAALASDERKGDAILGTMLEAKKLPDSRRIMEHLTHQKVRTVFELERAVANEAHLYTGFVRFSELENGVLFSKINPKNQILPCIAEHFANRLPMENWLIYDETHQTSLVHRAGKPWLLVLHEYLNKEEQNRVSSAEREFSRLWKGFFKSIAIKERESHARQRQHLPIRFRENMVEL